MDLNLHDLKYDCPKCGDDCTDIFVDATCMVILNLNDAGEVRDSNTQYERFDLDSMAECSNPKCKHRAPLKEFLGIEGKAEVMFDKLKAEGYAPRAYSGRGMNGRQCLAVNVDSVGEAVKVGVVLCAETPSAPSVDNMGRGYVLYWPDMAFPDSKRTPYCPQCGTDYTDSYWHGGDVECPNCGEEFDPETYRL